jgi:hypothetical protein
VEKIDLKFFLRWFPHILASELRQKRVEFTGQSLRILEQQQRVDFRDIVTSDESWFLQHYNHRKIRCPSVDEVWIRLARLMAASTAMLTVFLSIQGEIFPDRLQRGKVQQRIFLRKDTQAAFPRPIVHSDKAAPHRSAVTKECFQCYQFRHTFQSPSSLDISPCDFSLSGDQKMKFIGEELESCKPGLKSYLVKSHARQCDESTSTGSGD